jgi:hypothetical protein
MLNDKIVVQNPFSSLNSSIEDKVVQISVINSSNEQSLIVTPSNQVKTFKQASGAAIKNINAES